MRQCGLKNAKRNLYLIEEPTIGLHMAGVEEQSTVVEFSCPCASLVP